jgi:hypothetical protein
VLAQELDGSSVTGLPSSRMRVNLPFADDGNVSSSTV